MPIDPAAFTHRPHPPKNATAARVDAREIAYLVAGASCWSIPSDSLPLG